MTPLDLTRWRAQHILEALWRLTNTRTHWSTAPTKPNYDGRTNDKRASPTPGPAYLLISIKPIDRLNVPPHHARLWRHTLTQTYARLTAAEQTALENYTHLELPGNVFVVGPRGIIHGSHHNRVIAALGEALAAELDVVEVIPNE